MKRDALINCLIQSWANVEGNVNTTDELVNWISNLNLNTHVMIQETSISKDTFWFYDDYNGEILNRKRSFFSIKGVRLFLNNVFIEEQPIIIQPEIGYLGIICKRIDGVLNFLMQAKIEPGNINCVQISPTIQATKSNFTRVHGGNHPPYLEYFENSQKYLVIYDQIQSEQSSRFLKKRNRNMILYLEDDIPLLNNFRWMTLGQIKELMKFDNLVNMDTRTVLSGIPFILENYIPSKPDIDFFKDKTLYNSIFSSTSIQQNLVNIFQKINNYKMFQEHEVVVTSLNQLVDWNIDDFGITCNKQANFMVRYYDIEIEGREVQCWTQPLFKATGIAVYGIITKVKNSARKFLIKVQPEIGCFDKVELGPSIQWEASHCGYDDNYIDSIFRKSIQDKSSLVIVDNLLSEEGGRFYHEQNRNIIIELFDDNIDDERLPENYLWCDFATLNYLVQINNCLNIQLRNLLSLLPL